ncbi:MAG: acetoin utilization protein AcuC [Leptospiraceae bacterium]|nr:acetoin utilization protein AcuC [Leptospiraceae bacterium]MDW8306178.1 acetoin utilization protein AcuC [Leptospiraceae bacterium]
MQLGIVQGKEIAAYGFPHGHPFGPDRHDRFYEGFYERKLEQKCHLYEPQMASIEEIALFHEKPYIEVVQKKSRTGTGYLDYGDTPAFVGCFEAASFVVGSGLELAREIIKGNIKHGFLPIGGLHHARRNSASGFCIFNDCGVVIEYLLQEGFTRIAYVDIDAHHGDGVYYAFEEEPRLIFADIHQHGIYPGTGDREEKGRGKAFGTKLNIPLSWGADDEDFYEAWNEVYAFLDQHKPEFILMQCGADSLAHDPLTGLAYSSQAHRKAARDLVDLAEKYSNGRLLAFGGGGYNRENLKLAWNAVVEELL